MSPTSNILFLSVHQALLCVWLTVLLGKLLGFLIRDVPLGLQVCFVSYENDHLRTQRQSTQHHVVYQGGKPSCSTVELSVRDQLSDQHPEQQ